MDLYFMRHGEAEAIANSDAERKLTLEGKGSVEYVAEAFIRREWPLPMKLVTSSHDRAKETAEIVAKKLGIRDIKLVSYEDSTSWPVLRSYINDEAILFVGHQPALGEIIEEITGDSVPVKKASIHRLEYDFYEDKGKYLDRIENR